MILAFFAIFFVWGMLTKLDRTMHAVGQIVPTAQLQVMSNLEGGIVQETLAKQARSYVPMIRLFASIRPRRAGTSMRTSLRSTRYRSRSRGSRPNWLAVRHSFPRPRTLRSRSKLGSSGRCIFHASSTCKG